MKGKNALAFMAVLTFCQLGFAGTLPNTYTISGYIVDSKSGEGLIGANVFVIGTANGAVSNMYGFYSVSLNRGNYIIEYSYIGYSRVRKEIRVEENVRLDIELSEDATALEEVRVSANQGNDNITNLETGTTHLPIQSIKHIPAFMGEIDVIKAIQLLPGVQAGSEGSSGFNVRGGSTDQNLILLDEATVYNASHFIGFFSVFNNDAVKDVTLYKGDIPASSGGRLSSLLDVRMKDGNMKKFQSTGGIGTIASRLTLEGPIKKDKTSFLIAGRRTYADIFLPLAKNKDIRDNKLFFYDLNLKINHIFNDRNRLFVSGYFGRDVFENEFAGMNFGNSTYTLRWNHLFSSKLFSNFSLISSVYNYQLGTPEGQPSSFQWTSDMKDQSIKADFIYYMSPASTFKFGLISTYHKFNPGLAKGTGNETAFTEFQLPESFAFEHGVYGMGEMVLSDRISFKYGLRFSAFQNTGKATIYGFDDNYNVSDTLNFERGIYNFFTGLEPRLGFNYTLSEKSSLKASYSRTLQYMQLAQNSTAGTPLDIWFPSGLNIKPQISNQYSLGFFRNFRGHTFETSAEVYYKKMNRTIDFKDHANLLLNPLLEGEVRTGSAWSAGLELMVKLNQKRLNGWVCYTLSKTMRKIEGINNGVPYVAPYDKPHDFAVVLNYQISKSFNFGLNWIYTTGLPQTFPVGRYEILGTVLPLYSKRNAWRFDNYHRLDVSLNYKVPNRKGKRWQSEWNLSIYNLYNRKNTWAINFVPDRNHPERVYAEKTYLFSLIPAITYNFNF